MPVVINQFEAVADAPPPQAAPAQPPAPAGRIEPQSLRPALRRIAQRLERLKAH